jgi:hypothetical protein
MLANVGYTMQKCLPMSKLKFKRVSPGLLGRIETLETDKEPLKKWYLDLKSAKQVADVIVQRAGL